MKCHTKIEDAIRDRSDGTRRAVWSISMDGETRYVKAPSRLRAIEAAASSFGLEVRRMTNSEMILAMECPE